ncbi:hypothetical protein ABPG75_008447 [Micractinium tetrahymenae]
MAAPAPAPAAGVYSSVPPGRSGSNGTLAHSSGSAPPAPSRAGGQSLNELSGSVDAGSAHLIPLGTLDGAFLHSARAAEPAPAAQAALPPLPGPARGDVQPQAASSQPAGSPTPAAASHTASPSKTCLPWSQAEELLDFSFKLFGCTPDQLPLDLRSQLATALDLAPTVMRASIRKGCVCITGTLLATQAEVQRLAAAPGGAAVLARSQALRGQPSKLLASVGTAVVAANGASGAHTILQLRSNSSLPALQLASPAVLLAPPAGSNAPLQALLVGRGLSSPQSVLHCRNRGRHQALAVLRLRRRAAAAAGEEGWEEEPETGDHDTRDVSSSSDELVGPATWRNRAAGPLPDQPLPPAACQQLLDRLELADGEEAALIQLPPLAPSQAWGLFELEQAQGPLLSRSLPLLVLPRWAGAAASELRQAAQHAADGGWSAAGLLQHLGFLLHTAEWQQCSQGALEPEAARRVHRFARQLASFCIARGWHATASLLLPALAVHGPEDHEAAASAAAAKQGDAIAIPPTPPAVAAEEAAAALGLPAEERQELRRLLGQIAEQQGAAGHDGQPWEEDGPAAEGQPADLRARLAKQLPDWFWTGCNLAACMAGLALVLRSAMS